MSVSIIPESAPFNTEQRVWLNGFLAAWTGLQNGDGPGAEAALAAVGGGVATLPAPAKGEEDFPWHDDSLPIDERLALAEGKPLMRKLMAAMAQLNCGACGYLCKTYSEAIAAGEEKSLTLYSPGGKETAKSLKRLLKEQPVGEASASESAAPKPGESGWTRAKPYAATIKSCGNLNGADSSKHTTHAVIDLGDSGLTYNVGDSLGVYLTNCHELAGELLNQLGLAGDDPLGDRLLCEFNLRDATDELLELLIAATPDGNDENDENAVQALVDSDDLDELDVLQRAPSAELSPDDFLACLTDLSPRLYSIASSLRAHSGEVHRMDSAYPRIQRLR